MIEEFIKKNKYRREIMMLFPVIAGLFAGYLIVLQPSLEKLRGLDREISGFGEKESAYKYILDNEAKFEALRNRLAAGGDKAWLIEKMNELAQKENLSVVSTTAEDTRKLGEVFEVTSLRIEAEGTFHQLGSFVSSVESLDQYVRVQNLDITSRLMDVSAGAEANLEDEKKGLHHITLSVAVFNPVAGAL